MKVSFIRSVVGKLPGALGGALVLVASTCALARATDAPNAFQPRARTGVAPMRSNPAGPTPWNPAGPTPFDPAGPTPRNPAGAFAPGSIPGGHRRAPVGAVVSIVGGEGPQVPLADGFFCQVHGRGFASEQFFLQHLQAFDGVPADAAPALVFESAGTWIFTGTGSGE